MAPYLLPATNTVMTCSVYATVAVAINRYVEMSPSLSLPPRLENGVVQSLFVAVFSVVFNITRWFELEYVYVTVAGDNETLADGSVVVANETVVTLQVKKA